MNAKNSLKSSKINMEEIDYFGGCPECGKNNGCLNVGRSHWFICHDHKKRWFIGSNLFSGWKEETPEEWLRNEKILLTYEEVEPLLNPKYLADANAT